MPEAVIAPPRHSDAARRVADAMSLHAVCGNTGRFLAFRLADGTSDGQLFDTRDDAIRHQTWPQHCMFLQVQPGGMSAAEATAVLGYWRDLHDGGVNDSDPGVSLPLLPLTARERAQQVRLLTKGRL